jgi:hypothetical protein
MSAGYVIARENFKEAAKHVSAETDPVMFNLLYGLQSLAVQIEADFAALAAPPATVGTKTKKRALRKQGATASPSATKKKLTKARARSR